MIVLRKRRPNVLFLSVDALRADRMSLHGYRRDTTPNLRRLADNAVVCDNATSLAAFTQASFPSLMTSTRPLSHGGYDNGAAGRPATIFRAFADAGYHVVNLSTFKWVSRFFGYGDGVAREAHLFTPHHLSGAAMNRVKSTIGVFLDGDMDEAEMAVKVTPVFQELAGQVREFCAERKRQHAADLADFGDTTLIRSYFDFDAIVRVTDEHIRAFEASPAAYIRTYFDPMPRSHEWINRDWRYCRTRIGGARIALERVINRIAGVFDPGTRVLRDNRYKQYVDGHALTNRILRTLNETPDDRPCLIWTHFLDTHLPYLPGHGPDWYRQTPDYLAALGYERDIDPAVALMGRPNTKREIESWSALYDAAVLYIDEQIGRIADALEASGRADDTLVVFTSDHGEELCEHGNISHYFRLYDHNVRVPLMFHHPSLRGERIDSLATLLDLAPTMTAMAGIPGADGWEGSAVDSNEVAGREQVVMETFYGGNCIFERRPLYMAVRTKTHKYIWKEYLDSADTFSPDGPELYDLNTDPLEQRNIFEAGHPLVARFNGILAERLREIPEISDERIADVGKSVAPPAGHGGPDRDTDVSVDEMMANDRRVKT